MNDEKEKTAQKEQLKILSKKLIISDDNYTPFCLNILLNANDILVKD